MKHMKYFICPSSKRDYKFCGSVDGTAVNSKELTPSQNQNSSKLVIDYYNHFNINSKTLCNYEIVYPRGANAGDEIEIEIS